MVPLLADLAGTSKMGELASLCLVCGRSVWSQTILQTGLAKGREGPNCLFNFSKFHADCTQSVLASVQCLPVSVWGPVMVYVHLVFAGSLRLSTDLVPTICNISVLVCIQSDADWPNVCPVSTQHLWEVMMTCVLVCKLSANYFGVSRQLVPSCHWFQEVNTLVCLWSVTSHCMVMAQIVKGCQLQKRQNSYSLYEVARAVGRFGSDFLVFIHIFTIT